MAMDRRALGHRGEAIAARYYLDRGYTLAAHNYRTREGELDLVLKKGALLVIAEVKTRTATGHGQPCEAVDRGKQQRLVLAAGSYLAEFPHDGPVRFDVVEVLPGQNGWQVHCIAGAFEC